MKAACAGRGAFTRQAEICGKLPVPDDRARGIPMAIPVNPYLNNRFQVEIDGLATHDFAEVVLPEARTDVVEYREGGDRIARKVAGAVHVSNLVLRRGITQSNDLFAWWKTVADGQADRRNMSIILLDQQGQEVKRWNIFAAWPARYSVAPLVALEGDIALMETLECAVEGFEVA
jgi:phage tail-like protein